MCEGERMSGIGENKPSVKEGFVTFRFSVLGKRNSIFRAFWVALLACLLTYLLLLTEQVSCFDAAYLFHDISEIPG